MLYYETVEPRALDVIKKIMALPPFDDFRLAGSTALTLQMGHRLSNDVDFCSGKKIKQDEIFSSLYRKFDITILKQTPYNAIISIDEIKIHLRYNSHPWLKPVIAGGLKMEAIGDIAATKLLSLTTTEYRHDFFDIWFLLKRFSLTELTVFFKNRYDNYSLFMILQSLVYFRDAEADVDPKLLSEKVSWNEVKKKLENELRAFSAISSS